MLFNLSDYFYIWAHKKNGETLQPAVIWPWTLQPWH